MTWATTRFAAGGAIGLVGRETLALVLSDDRAVRDTLWAMVAVDAAVDEILDALSGHGLRNLPSFAIARLEGDDVVRVVVRGVASVRLVTVTGEVVVESRSAKTWIEREVDGVIEIGLDSDEAADSCSFQVLAGAVPASSLVRTLAEIDPHAGAAASGWALAGTTVATSRAGDEPIDDESAPADPTSEMSFGLSGHGGSDEDPVDEPAGFAAGEATGAGVVSPLGTGAVGVASTAAVEDDEDDEGDEGDEDGEEVDVDAVAGDVVGLPGEQSDADGADASVVPPLGTEAAGSTPALAAGPPIVTPSPFDSGATLLPTDLEHIAWPAEAAVEAAPAGEDDAYDYLFGRTVARSVQQAAVQAPDDAHDAGNDGHLIAGVPLGAPSSAPPAAPSSMPPPSPGSPVMGDHDGHTISRAELARLRAENAIIPAGPVVQARLCVGGHPNPTHLTVCRTCGGQITADPPVSVPRPILGVLRFSNGVVVQLDRPQLIGRSPKIEGHVGGELPNLVKLDQAGQGVSRRHVAVHLENWQVLLEDLNSANGTIVALPGRPARRLVAGEPVALEHGTVVDLGGEMSMSFEVSR